MESKIFFEPQTKETHIQSRECADERKLHCGVCKSLLGEKDSPTDTNKHTKICIVERWPWQIVLFFFVKGFLRERISLSLRNLRHVFVLEKSQKTKESE